MQKTKYYDSRNNCNAIINSSNNKLIVGCKNTIIPNSVKSIGNRAFSFSRLTSLTIPNSVTSIESSAFYYCESLTSITIPSSVTKIEYGTFWCCYNLKSITIPNSVNTIGMYAFYQCYNLQSVTIPNSVTSIEDAAFYRCNGLTSITIPNSVTSIGSSAFQYCDKLQSITIPKSVKSIKDYAFNNCPINKSVTVLWETPPTINYWVSGGSYGTLHVPKGCASSYKAKEYWANFTIIENAVDKSLGKCKSPIITFTSGKIACSSATSGAVCHYKYNIINSSGAGDNGADVILKIKISAYATAEGFEDSDTVTETFDNKVAGGSCDVNGDGIVNMQDANIIVNKYLGK